MNPDETEPYTVVSELPQFKVVDWDGAGILVCSDANSAGQYAALLGKAFRRGYKVGRRKGSTDS